MPVVVDGGHLLARGDLAACVVVVAGREHHVVLLELDVVTGVPAQRERGAGLHEAVQADRGLVARGDRVDHEAGAGVDVAAHEDVGLVGLVGLGVRDGALSAAELDLAACQQVAPLDGLADGEDHVLARHERGVRLVVGGREALGLVEDARAALEGDAAHAARLVELDLRGAPAVVDRDAVVLRLLHLEREGRHLVRLLKAPHAHVIRAAAPGHARRVDGHVAAADDDGRALDLVLRVVKRAAQEVNGRADARRVLAVHAGLAAALAADRDVERLEALLAQLLERDVAADLHATADLDAHLAQDVDLCRHDVLLELVAGDAVDHHAAGKRVLLEHDGVVAHVRQVVRAAEAGGSRAHDGDLLEVAATVGGNYRLRHKAVLRLHVLRRDERLHVVDGDGLVHQPARAGGLAALVADATAHRRERVLLLDERQRVAVASLRGHAQVALDRDVRGARDLARRGAGFVALDAVVVLVVGIPVLLAPGVVVGKRLLGIGDAAVLGQELLAKLHGARGADLDAAAACHALLLVHVGAVGACAHVGRVEQLGRAQRVAHVHVAVADAKDLALAVDVRDLVHVAVLLGVQQDVDDLVVGDVVALAGLDAIVCQVAHANAPVLRVAAGVVGAGALRERARARAHREVVVLLQPVREVLDVRGLVLVLDGVLHGDDVHADAGTSGRDHLRGHGERQVGHALEERSQLGVVVQLLLVHDRELRGAGDEHGQDVALLALGVLPVEVLPVVLDAALDGHGVEKFLGLLLRHARACGNLLQGLGDAALHVARERGLLLRHDGREAPVVGVVVVGLVEHAVRHLGGLAQNARLRGLGRRRARCVHGGRHVVLRAVVLHEGLACVDDAQVATLRIHAGDPVLVKLRLAVADGDVLVRHAASHRLRALLDARSAVVLGRAARLGALLVGCGPYADDRALLVRVFNHVGLPSGQVRSNVFFTMCPILAVRGAYLRRTTLFEAAASACVGPRPRLVRNAPRPVAGPIV